MGPTNKGKPLPFPKKRYVPKDYILHKPLLVSDGNRTHLVAAGEKVILLSGQNHGYVRIPEPGTPWGQRIFRV
jgi:hypothetical protein